jgi:hypothetical protein
MQKNILTCACLHNMLAADRKIRHLDPRVGRGALLGKDGIYMYGHTTPPNVDKSDLHLAKEFGKRQKVLATHLCAFCEKGPISD